MKLNISTIIDRIIGTDRDAMIPSKDAALPKIKSIHMGSDGRIIAVDQEGRFINDLQINLIELWATLTRMQGYDPAGVKILTAGRTLMIQETDMALEYKLELL